MNVFYDLTLRSPGIDSSRKVELAKALDEVGVGELEVGCPSISEDERATVKEIAGEDLRADVFVVCTPSMSDVDNAISCDVDGVVLRAEVDEVDRAGRCIEYASEHVKVALAIENPTGIPIRRLLSAYRTAADYGMDRVHLSECLGLASYELVECYVTALKEMGCELLCHFRNYLGLATANSVKALMSGADKVAVSVNGVGGNAPLHEVAIALELIYGFHTGIRFERMGDLSRMVEALCGSRAPGSGYYLAQSAKL